MTFDRRQAIDNATLQRVREELHAHDQASTTPDADDPVRRRTDDVDRVREQLQEHDEDAEQG